MTDEPDAPVPDPAESQAIDGGVATNLPALRTPTRTRPPGWEHGRQPPVPRHVKALRTAMVARAMVRGLGRAAILEAVAKAQHDEAQKRSGAIATGSTIEEARDLVPILWGDAIVPERTVDEYIKRAKVVLADEGAKVVQHREFVFAMQLARYNEVFRAAFAAGRYGSCIRALERVDKLFGLEEAIKVMLLSVNVDANRPSQPGHDLTSEAGRAAALASIMAKAGEQSEAFRGVLARFAQSTGAQLGTTTGS